MANPFTGVIVMKTVNIDSTEQGGRTAPAPQPIDPRRADMERAVGEKLRSMEIERIRAAGPLEFAKQVEDNPDGMLFRFGGNTSLAYHLVIEGPEFCKIPLLESEKLRNSPAPNGSRLISIIYLCGDEKVRARVSELDPRFPAKAEMVAHNRGYFMRRATTDGNGDMERHVQHCETSPEATGTGDGKVASGAHGNP